MEKLNNRLAAIFDTVLEEAASNREFAERLERALGTAPAQEKPTKKNPDKELNLEAVRRSNRRAKAAVDPFALLSAGEPHLRAGLAKLSLEQLKDVVAEYGMDTSRLALKWKSNERLVDFIVTTVVARNRKGDVFREASASPTDTAPEPGNVPSKPPSTEPHPE